MLQFDLVKMAGATAVLCLAACTAAPAPPPDVPSRTALPTPTLEAPPALPPGLEDVATGRIYADAGDSVLRIDLDTKRIDRFTVPRFTFFRSFTAIDHGLVVKQVDDGVGFVLTDAGELRELPEALRGPGRLHSAGEDAIWAVAEYPVGDRRLVSLVDAETGALIPQGASAPLASLGIPTSDGGTGMVFRTTDGIYEMTRDARTRILEPDMDAVAIGPFFIVVRPCAGCDLIERPRQGTGADAPGTPTGLREFAKQLAAPGSGSEGSLSPHGRFVALNTVDADDAWRLAVTDMATGESTLVPGVVTRSNGNDQTAWLDDRWLLAVTDQTLRILDTHTFKVHAWEGVTVDRIAVRPSSDP